MKKEEKTQEKKKKKNSGFRLFGKILLGIFIFIILLILFIRSPWGQGIITDRIVSYISNKTNTKVEIGSLFITFDGDISLEDLYLEDEDGDTLVYSREFEADIPLWSVISGNGIAIDNVEWSGVRANIERRDTIAGFNFQFLMDALVPTDTTATATAPTATDTTASAGFTLGDFDLEDFKISYTDQYMGIETKVELGSLEVEMQEFSMDSMYFEIGDASLENTRFSYLQTKAFPQQESQEEAPMPFFSIGSFKINNVVGDYQSIPDGFLADVDIEAFLLEMPQADLAQNQIEISMLGLKDSEILIKTSETAENTETNLTPAEGVQTSPAFEWPVWNVVVSEISLVDNRFNYRVNNNTPSVGVLNPNALAFKDLDFQAKDIALGGQSFKASVAKLNFQEISGLELKQTEFQISVDEENMRLSDLEVRLNDNYLQGDLAIDYESLSEFIEQPENASVALDLPEFNVDLTEILKLQPDLQQNPYMTALAEKDLRGSLAASGKLSAVEITTANVQWGANTSLSAKGTVFNATDPDNLSFNFPRLQFSSGRGDISAFVEEQDLGIQLPADLNLSGSISGSPEDITVDAVLNSSAGKIAVDGSFKSAPGIAFDAEVEVTQLEIGQLLQNEALGPVSLDVTATGGGEDLNSLDAMVEGSVTQITYNGYEFNDIELEAELEDGEGYANVDYKDENLNFELASSIELDSVAPAIALQLNLIGADLEALGLSQQSVRAAMDVTATFEGNAENFDLTANINDGIFVYDDEPHLLGDVDLLAHVTTDTTALDVRNRMLNLKLRSNAGPADFVDALTRHYQSYFTEEEYLDTIGNPVNVELFAEVNPSPVLQEVLLPQLEELDTLSVLVDFRELEKSLTATVQLPYINYMGAEIDSLRFNLDSDREGLVFDFGLRSLDYGPLAIKETIMDGQLEDGNLILDFASDYEGEQLMHIRTLIASEDGETMIHIDPQELILDYEDWDILPENAIIIGENEWVFEDFVMSRNDQLFRIGNDLTEIQEEHIGLEFENFTLAALLSYLNPEEVLASGKVNGNFIIESPFGETGLLADLIINEFAVMDVSLGQLSLDAEAIGGNTYNLDLAVSEGPADLVLTGSYIADAEAANLDMELEIIEVQMEVLEGFAEDFVNTTTGSFSGEIALNGTTAEPLYDGFINFNDAGFTVAMLDAPFVLVDETLRIDNEGIYMDNFAIQDVNSSPFVINGAILTPTYTNPEFDLSFSTENFTALSSTEEDYDLFYGTAIFDAEGSVTGNLVLPRVELELTVDEETDVTYVIPEADLGIEEREGVVIFVNKENPDRILTQTEEEEEAFAFAGFALNSFISLQENATFTIVLDEDTGDHFQASGEGDLLYDIYPNGRTTMSGRVEINDGYYEMSLYDLVTRRFEIMDGSSVVWSGDPLDADLNITAVYEVEASASALMAPQLTGSDMDVRQKFQQELEFLVYLRIGGEISAPVISFGLDMPEDEQGAISGQVYGRVQQINQQENQLNKQVFSLLVLNRFFPDSGSPGTGGGTLSFARDNLNSALSDQLNVFSDRLLGETGINLNFGLDSYTDYQGEAPEERTQLDIAAEKSFLDDRLTVSVGSEVDLQGSSQVDEPSPVVGNVSLEYLLTEDGQLRLQAFRRKSYENVIDGQLILSGLALVYSRDFNKFNELWNQLFKDEEKQQQEEPEEKQKTEN